MLSFFPRQSIHITFFLIGSLTFLVSPSSRAENIKVITEYLPPFQVKNDDGSLGGYATEVVHALFAHTKDTPNILVYPWARGYAIASNEKNVLIYSMARTQEREQNFHWIGPLRYERFYFWGLKKKFEKPVNTIEKLKQFTIASSKEYNSDQYLTKHNFHNIYRVTKDIQIVNMLYRERVDLVLSNDLIIKTLIEDMGHDFSKIIKLFEAKDMSSQLSIAFSKDTDKALVVRFQQAYQHLHSSGKLREIQKSWSIIDD